MEGSVYKFIKPEWKVRDTYLAHWVSRLNIEGQYELLIKQTDLSKSSDPLINIIMNLDLR